MKARSKGRGHMRKKNLMVEAMKRKLLKRLKLKKACLNNRFDEHTKLRP